MILIQNNKEKNKRIIAYKIRRLNIIKKNYLIIEKKYLTIV